MRGGRAIVFTLDAFVAFAVLALCLQSLVLLYAYPTGFLDEFERAFRLANDVLHAFSVVNASVVGAPTWYADKPLLFYLVDYAETDPTVVSSLLDPIIPTNFGYRLSYWDGHTWQTVFDSKGQVQRPSEQEFFAAAAQTSLMVQDRPESGTESCYGYNTCHGAGTLCDFPVSFYKPPRERKYLVRLVIYR